MSKEDIAKQKELRRLMRKLKEDKMPTMMYKIGEPKDAQRREDENPW